jgi:hypothetical protein
MFMVYSTPRLRKPPADHIFPVASPRCSGEARARGRHELDHSLLSIMRAVWVLKASEGICPGPAQCNPTLHMNTHKYIHLCKPVGRFPSYTFNVRYIVGNMIHPGSNAKTEALN